MASGIGVEPVSKDAFDVGNTDEVVMIVDGVSVTRESVEGDDGQLVVPEVVLLGDVNSTVLEGHLLVLEGPGVEASTDTQELLLLLGDCEVELTDGGLVLLIIGGRVTETGIGLVAVEASATGRLVVLIGLGGFDGVVGTAVLPLYSGY